MVMPIDDAYLVWLYRQVGPDTVENRNRSRTYWTLLRFLYTKEFVWVDGIEHDANRAQDGIDLRRQFLQDTGVPLDDPGFMDMECSVLEMLVALAWHVAFEGGGTQPDRFWEMIANLGLTDCVDANPPNQRFVNSILDRVMNREYGSDGAGGLFPLEHPDRDQREIEIRYQAAAYLLEEMDAA